MDSDEQVDITMQLTVPVAHARCNILAFQYDHYDPNLPGVESNGCIAFFSEKRLVHTLRLRAQQTPGCNSYTTLVKFKPFDRRGADNSIWWKHVPTDITVRL